MKQTYEKPHTELYLLEPKGSLLLENSVEGMNPITGSWEEEGQ